MNKDALHESCEDDVFSLIKAELVFLVLGRFGTFPIPSIQRDHEVEEAILAFEYLGG